MSQIIRRKPYKIRTEETWDLIRSAYVRGATAPRLAEVFDVTEWAIRNRAKKEGWSKRAWAALVQAQEAEAQAGPEASAPPPASEPWAADPRDAGPWASAPWAEELEPAPPPSAPPMEEWTSWKDPPPESLRQGPRPLPGLPSARRRWAPPPGQGPMPPHLVPPVERPPPEDAAGEARSPAGVAEQAVAAAGRAIAEGRYAEAERLGKLAETMRRLEGAGPGRARPAPEGEGRDHPFAGQDEVAGDLPAEDRPLNCTARSCAMKRVQDALEARLDDLCEDLMGPESEDVEAWADMAQAVGARVDPEVAELAAALNAQGLDGLHDRLADLFGPPPQQARAPEVALFRGR